MLVRGASPHDSLLFHCKPASCMSYFFSHSHPCQIRGTVVRLRRWSWWFRRKLLLLKKHRFSRLTSIMFFIVIYPVTCFAMWYWVPYICFTTTYGFQGQWPYCRRCKCCIHIHIYIYYTTSLIRTSQAYALTISNTLNLFRRVVALQPFSMQVQL